MAVMLRQDFQQSGLFVVRYRDNSRKNEGLMYPHIFSKFLVKSIGYSLISKKIDC